MQKKRFAFKSAQQKKEGAKKKTTIGAFLKMKIVDEESVKNSQTKQFVYFILGFLVSYLVLTFIVGALPQTMLKEATGKTVEGLLNAQGITTNSLGIVSCTETSWLGEETPGECYSFFVQSAEGQLCNMAAGVPCEIEGKTIIISSLCTGALEIIILVSAILASFGVTWRKKIAGVIAAVILGIIFNLLRIDATINIILSQNIQTVELAHDFLFRIILFAYIVAVYVIWFYWAARERGKN